MGVAVGNVSMEEKQVFQNVQMSVNFLVSLLKKNWQNVSFTPPPPPHLSSVSSVSLYSVLAQTGEVLVLEDNHWEAGSRLLSPGVSLSCSVGW